MAHDRLIERGHCKFATADEQGRNCVYGAIIEATMDRPAGVLVDPRHLSYAADPEVAMECWDALALLGELVPIEPIAYNNADSTTVNDILDLVHRGIIEAKERGI